jgi:hypothetical protein
MLEPIVMKLGVYVILRPSQRRTYEIPLISSTNTTTYKIFEIITLILPEFQNQFS